MGAEDRLNHPLAQEQSHCVFSKTQKQPQCTCQAKTVAGSSLTPHAALLVHPSGHIWTVMNLHGQKMLPVKTDLVIFSPVIVCLNSARVWLSSQAMYKMDFSSCGIIGASLSEPHTSERLRRVNHL